MRGVSLIEVLIAVLVLAIGTVAAMRSIGQATRGIGGAADRVLATEAALNRAAELRLGLPPGPARLGPVDWRIEVRDTPARFGLVETQVTARAEGRPGAAVTLFRTAE